MTLLAFTFSVLFDKLSVKDMWEVKINKWNFPEMMRQFMGFATSCSESRIRPSKLTAPSVSFFLLLRNEMCYTQHKGIKTVLYKYTQATLYFITERKILKEKNIYIKKYILKICEMIRKQQQKALVCKKRLFNESPYLCLCERLHVCIYLWICG